jgi:hypothetical protein
MNWKAADWILVTKDRVKWQAVLNTVTTEYLPSNEVNFMTRKEKY